MKTSTLFAALSAAAMTLCTAAAAAQTVQAAPQAATPAPGTPWSLDDCIGYALHNNVGVQQQALQVEQTDVKLSTSKYSRLPDLSASVGYNATFGRGTSDDNIRKTGTIQSGSFDGPACPSSTDSASTAKSRAASSTSPPPCRIWNAHAKTCQSTS